MFMADVALYPLMKMLTVSVEFDAVAVIVSFCP